MNIKEVVEQLEKVFPIDDIAVVGRVAVVNKMDPSKGKIAWKIIIGDGSIMIPAEEDKE